MINRRHFLYGSAMAGLATAMTGPRIAYATAPGENRFVMIILRGGMDGLHALPPYADPYYKKLRPRLAVKAPGFEGGVLNLDGSFGLHPAFEKLLPLYKSKELLFIPAASTRYRKRSHFDGQNILENGTGKPFGANDGWLNRALTHLNDGDQRLGLALGSNVPLILQGGAGVQSWGKSPFGEVDEDFLMRLTYAYEEDKLFSSAFSEARNAPKIPGMDEDAGKGKRKRNKENTNLFAKATAELLNRDDGPRIAVMETTGWDTHFGQAGRLNRLFKQLGSAILTLKHGLQDNWVNTQVLVVSEFGRTAAENGNGGTDHGVGGLAILAGGAIKGGQVVGDWPGLSPRSLYEGRDVFPTTDCESIFKSILSNGYNIGQAVVEDQIFPNSRKSIPLDGLFKGA
ncbi:hypothetical protein A9Q83_09835 [Alphaproteobacteria bacterium 46_93_T64]|nr:hypothetical protein A9Q83_09835 [Alphaproteobacteria bacterium 46_93_T64]